MKLARACLMLTLALFAVTVDAQTTSFTYQGSLQASGSPSNGNFDFEFALFDALAAGSQVGMTQSAANVAVANGTFTVTLDFGSVFTGPARFLEIRVRQAGQPSFTTLAPRQRIANVPYAVRSLSAETASNALQLGGTAAGQFVLTTDPRLSDTRPPTPASSFYIQNSDTPQASSNFNISGTGAANVFDSAVGYRLNGDPFLGGGPTFVSLGRQAGTLSTGNSNVFVGNFAGRSDPSGSANTFVGQGSGISFTSGFGNSLFGRAAGNLLVTGNENTFVGSQAGFYFDSGTRNSFFGYSAGMVGDFGTPATGSENSAVGYRATPSSGLTNATAIGARARVTASNSIVLGSINGINFAEADTNVGIGTTAPAYRLHVVGDNVRIDGQTPTTFPRFSLNFTGGGTDQKKWQNYATSTGLSFTALNDEEASENPWMIVGRGTGIGISSVRFPNGNVLIGLASSPDKLAVGGSISFSTLSAGGATTLCRNASNQISSCSSSIRYKKDVFDFTHGLDLVRKLRPVSFAWKADDQSDLGLIAEEVAATEPLLASYNEEGQVEGVKYDRVGVVLVNAVNEQQAIIDAQQKQISEQEAMIRKQQARIDRQQQMIDQLRTAVCSVAPAAAVCKPGN